MSLQVQIWQKRDVGLLVVRIFFFISSYTGEEIYNFLNNLREDGNIMRRKNKEFKMCKLK